MSYNFILELPRPDAIPADAIVDEDGNVIVDEDGNIIVDET